ncbi:MAG: NAD(P)-dependent oxidoreductase [Thermoplasmatota archaeon]
MSPERAVRLETLKVVTWRIPRVDAAALETLTVAPESEEKTSKALAGGPAANGVVLLDTCQRVLVATTTDAPLAAVKEHVVKTLGASKSVEPESFEGFPAFAHLAEVAASLDSLVPGEAQVLGQMKDAFRNAEQWGVAGHGLAHVGSLVFRSAKRVRSTTDLFRGKVSLIPLTLDVVAAHLAPRDAPTRCAVVGTGEIARKMAEKLAESGARVTFVSRDPARGEEAARTVVGARHETWAKFLREAPAFDVIAFATRVNAPILGRGDAARFAAANPARGPLLLLDLSLPRCVAAEAATAAGVKLVALDELTALSEQAKAGRERELVRARDVLAKELASVEALYAALPHADEVVALRERFMAAAEERWARGAEKLPLDTPEMRLWYEQTVKHLLHVAQKETKESKARE